MKTKKCFKCEEDKSLIDFYLHNETADGYLNKCKQCTKKDSLNHRWNNIEKIRAYDRERGLLPHRIKKNVQTTKLFRKKFPQAYKAHGIINTSLQNGKISKQEKCSICENIPLQMEAHHENYNKPLEIIWLCSSCHRKLHRDLRIVTHG